MPPRRRTLGALGATLALALVLGLTACGGGGGGGNSGAGGRGGPADRTLRIVAGSEQKAILDQIVVPWCTAQRYTCDYTLLGSVDQARALQSGSTTYDAYWFASSVFAQIGDSQGRLRDTRSMFVTPVVFAGRRSAMQRLGLTDRPQVTVGDVLTAIQSGDPHIWSTNPTQSNSGATTLLAFMNHFAGNGPGQPLTAAQLDSPQVDQGITTFVQSMDRTPPSTGTMMQECVDAPDQCDAVFTYEALVIEQNQQLVAQGKEPFYAVYPEGALAISDAPFGFLPTGEADAAKEKIFSELQDHLLNDPKARRDLLHLGRRPADSIGLTLDQPDTTVFDPAWGIKTDIREQGISYPSAAVIEQVLERYHTRYRRPVTTYYCLDGSGSMSGDGWDGVKEAAHQIFDPDQARLNLLQTGPEDRTTVAVFNDHQAAGPFTVDGNDPARMRQLEADVTGYEPGGGTNMYRCLDDAVAALARDTEPGRKKLIVVMSDGQSSGSAKAGQDRVRAAGVPVVAIAFGDADPEQLTAVAQASGGAYVESDDLVSALREAAGYK
ncbi:vWA domain-containing protein [Raineyella sp. LH-20]|uniref:vWA domain-containing protein n=1 Tax=Raineyella sp. LH-20 TaxID=3081204 RepID=UPI0029539E48|nr:vWA domain-containing protein [Raineyella sp. LH-20]WOP18743.1 vWA domain-containing protein [Raineyella sp. LH-20]